jgi:tetratricopeptide (TPR) repeat protein
LGTIVPSDGTCAAVLNIAARNADPALATSVVQLLSARRCHEAWQVLLDMKSDGHQLPVTAANVVLEALGTLGKVDEAYTYYKRLHEICPSGPNTETVNTVLQAMQRCLSSQKSRAMFLASEMQALKIKPNVLTYDRLIMICLQETDYEDAFRYLAEMEEFGRDSVENDRKGWWMRPGTAARMVRTCAVRADERAYEIMKKMEERGMPYLDQLKMFIEDEWGRQAVEDQEKI